MGNWNNYGTDSLELEKNERSVSGKVDESGSGYLEYEMLKEGRGEVISRHMWICPLSIYELKVMCH